MEVARRAGVSQATVSRVINRAASVSPETVDSVTRAMRQLGYTPRRRRRIDGAARTRSRRLQGVIALVMLDDSMNVHPSLALAKLRGVEAALAREGLSLGLARADGADALPSLLQRDDLQGVLLWGHTLPQSLREHLAQVPVMWLSSHAEGEGNVILAGNEQAGRLAAEYLNDRGIRRPALLCPANAAPQYALRCDGFRYGMYLAGKEVRALSGEGADGPGFEQLAPSQQRAGIESLVDGFSALRPAADGLFVPDDSLTAMVFPAMQRRGIRPGADLLVVSCGNEPAYLAGLHPRPATVDLGPETTGRLAVERLLHRIRGVESPDRVSILIEPRLVLGEEPPYASRSA